MTISEAGVGFICSFEGFSATPYSDPGTGQEPFTIGFGTTIYPDGTKVTMADSPISRETALSYVKDHIDSRISGWLHTNLPALTQSQFDSLCSFIYNCGLGNFKSSTLYKDVKKQTDCSVITTDFGMWNKASHKVLAGLTRRRAAEAHLYCTGSYGSI